MKRRFETICKQQSFKSFRLSAAGKDSQVFERIKTAFRDVSGLSYDDEGELLIRIRPFEGAWQVLMRLSPRPLSARLWRKCNVPGGLNATLAAAMVRASGAKAGQRLFNPMCGSATLAIEAKHYEPLLDISACDFDEKMLACAQENIFASGHEIKLSQADALGFEADPFDIILVNPPWGDATGDNAQNHLLYPKLLSAMRRLSHPQTRLILLSHEIKLMEKLLAESKLWRSVGVERVFHGGHYPRMWGLEPK
ncbi:MAG: methyltransferase [Deinococcales bacterium]